MALAVILAVALVAASLLAVRAVARDYRVRRSLHWDAVAGIYLSYALHAAFVAACARAHLVELSFLPYACAIAGLVLAGCGFVLFVAGAVSFGSIRRMSGLSSDADVLITGGAYRFSRNPQNVGWILFLFGVALAGRSLVAMATVLGFAVLYHVYVRRVEEPYLRRVYGESFASYVRATPRYLGLQRRSSLPAVSLPVDVEPAESETQAA